MKKALMTFALAAASLAVVSAQEAPANILGVRAGVNFSTISSKSDGKTTTSDARTGFHIGVSEQFRLAPVAPLYLETGLYYTTRGGKNTETDEDGDKYTEKMNTGYLQLPVMLSYHFRLGDNATLQPAVGLYYGLGLGGKMKMEETYGGKTYKESYKLFKKETITEDGDSYEIPQTLKRSDFGLRFSLAATIGQFYVGAGYDLGLSNIAKKNVGYDHIKNRNWTLSVGFNF